MSYQYHGTTDLIALPNRTVQTFPSGLVRVERSFVCRKDQVAKYRNTIKVNESMPFDDGAPAIDGLYIFPEPQEIVRDDGFVEFRVTAYGRTNIFSNANIEKSSTKSEYFRIDATVEGTPSTVSLPSINDIFIIRGVIPSDTPTISILTPPTVSNLSVYNIINRVSLVEGVVIVAKNYALINDAIFDLVEETQIRLRLDSYQSTNFGLFSEYSITWQAVGVVSTYLR